MIPDLLWRCPLCATNDALIQKRRLFRPLQIHCTHCGAIWRVRRVVGDDYWLEVVASPSMDVKDVKMEAEVGTDLPLARWYARMKETIELTPIPVGPVGPGLQTTPIVTLADGEQLYLASRQITLAAEADDPLFFEGQGDTRQDRRDVGRGRVGLGRFFLTNQRLIWQGEDGRERNFSLERLNSVYSVFNLALVILYEMRLYQVRFLQESLLKWLTYFAYVAKEVKAASGHLITTSNY